MKCVCPQCGSVETRRRSVAERVCCKCGTRFAPPTLRGERSIFALVFLVVALVLGVAALGLFEMALDVRARQRREIFFGFGSGVGILALMCFIQGLRELEEPAEVSSGRAAGDSFSKSVEAESLPFVLPCPPLLPEEEAERLVREVAEKHGAKRILQTLGRLRQMVVHNAAACFAQQMDDDETPLTLIDTSFLGNGKAGFLLTNRGLYSSYCLRPVWLADINDVCYTTPGFGIYFFLYLSTAGMIVCAYLGGMLGFVLPPRPFSPGWCILSGFFSLYLAMYLTFGSRQLRNRLLVNGKTVCGGKRLRGDFWIELLWKLAEAARQTPASESISKSKPNIVVLQIRQGAREGDSVEVLSRRNPAWHDLEQSIRALDQDSHPSLRIWAGEVEQASALDILGGNGKYVLRELGDGWVYYDPSASEEEIEVCTGLPIHRAPAYYVCTDLQRVLEIARHYIETGTPE